MTKQTTAELYPGINSFYINKGGILLPLSPDDPILQKDRDYINRYSAQGEGVLVYYQDQRKMAPILKAELQDFKWPDFTMFLIGIFGLQILITFFVWRRSPPEDLQPKILASIEALASGGATKHSSTGAVVVVPTKEPQEPQQQRAKAIPTVASKGDVGTTERGGIIAAYDYKQPDPAVQSRLDELNKQNQQLQLALAKQEAATSCPVVDRLAIYNEIKAEYTADERQRMRDEARALYKEEARVQCLAELKNKKELICNQ